MVVCCAISISVFISGSLLIFPGKLSLFLKKLLDYSDLISKVIIPLSCQNNSHAEVLRR